MKNCSRNTIANPHWIWHALVAVSVLLLGAAAVLHFQPSPKPPPAEAQQHLIVIACIVMSIGCLMLWSMRRILLRDWRTTLSRQTSCTAPLARDITPAVLPPRLQTGLWCVLALWMGWVVCTLTVDDRLAAKLTLENGLLQDLTVLCYAAAALLFSSLILRSLRPSVIPGLTRWWLLTLLLGCLGVAGEEINWGQSVLEFETPEFFARTNIQHEVSLHNLELPGLPGRHWSNDVLLLISLFGGAVLPVLIFTSRQVRKLIWVAEIPVPPWVSQGYFLAAALIPRDGNLLGRLSRDNIPSELREVTIACAMLIWAWALWRRRSATPADSEDHMPRDGERGETRIQRV